LRILLAFEIPENDSLGIHLFGKLDYPIRVLKHLGPERVESDRSEHIDRFVVQPSSRVGRPFFVDGRRQKILGGLSIPHDV
jgi:hypothetical protein